MGGVEAGSVAEQLAAATCSDSVDPSLSHQLQGLAAGALHLNLHIADRQHACVLASGNLLTPGLLTSSLHPQAESLIGAEALGAGPKLWQLAEKRT